MITITMTYREISIDLNNRNIDYYEDGELVGLSYYNKDYYTADQILELFPETYKRIYYKTPDYKHISRMRNAKMTIKTKT